MSVFATMKGAERKWGTINAMRRASPLSASHSSINPTRVPVREISMCLRETYSSSVSRPLLADRMLPADDAGHPVFKKFRSAQIGRRLQYRIEAQHDVEIIVLKLRFRETATRFS